MSPYLANLWSIALIVFFFGGSIFVHEMGHFLAARRRGMAVERFSIGFGPIIWSRRGKDGVQYCISLLPVGGYVLLPQLADMSVLEGASKVDRAALPPISYATKMIVLAAGAAFNVIFAFVLASILWVVGLPTSSIESSTRIGAVEAQIALPDGTKEPSPAALAGLKAGDIIKRIDGQPVHAWADIRMAIVLGTGHSTDGDQREVTFDLDRDGQAVTALVHPVIAGEEQNRLVGIEPAYAISVAGVTPGSPAAGAGAKPGDLVVACDDTEIYNAPGFEDFLKANAARGFRLTVERDGHRINLAVPATPADDSGLENLGLDLEVPMTAEHTNPFKTVALALENSVQTLTSLLNRHSDIHLKNLSGAVGIIHIYKQAADASIVYVVWITVIINISLAFLNLLPIPVLDGGHMMFATIGQLRGRPLPIQLVGNITSVFMVLIITLMVYVNYHGLVQWMRADPDAPPAAKVAEPAPAK